MKFIFLILIRMLCVNQVLVLNIDFVDIINFILLNMLLLKDIDECIDSSTCDHNCTNKKGSFDCSCAVGYRLGNDGKSCTGTECVSNYYLWHYFTTNLLFHL